MISLRDQIVCITGASSGIGAACAQAFAREGARLILSARRKDRLDTIARRLIADHAVHIHTMELDVTNKNRVEEVFSSLPPEWR
ncbi:MAG TPA: SDR family NAD(P)-dependent oxidoreductase, partial [Bacteroidota bacterium]|nr:SDR family NAD(P)-dependent oxidoreductase [Bacteroidota bacterium]